MSSSRAKGLKRNFHFELRNLNTSQRDGKARLSQYVLQLLLCLENMIFLVGRLFFWGRGGVGCCANSNISLRLL